MGFLAQEIIRRKRDGASLSDEEIGWFASGIADGGVAAEQASAFAMAVLFRGMDARETAALTRAMTATGVTLDWRGADLAGPALDKHSTGGIGDNVSLILAPAVAACGAHVAMIAGRGLGHTGGTVDKLESIPGYRTAPERARFQHVVRDVGCAIIGQTDDLAPADRRLYAIRDATATVESIPLIVASILSKKLAAGLGALVMDVKTGGGAFMSEYAEAEALARALVSTGAAAGLPVRAFVTDMHEPLAPAAGNALEVRNALDNLTGARRDARLMEVATTLGGAMLAMGGLAADDAEGAEKIRRAISSGAAAERFARMVAALGGPRDLLERADRLLPRAPVTRDILAGGAGAVAAIDTRALGLAVVALGGGRRFSGDAIDLSVGLSDLAAVGASGPLIARVHARDRASADEAAAAVRAAYRFAEHATARAVVHGEVA